MATSLEKLDLIKRDLMAPPPADVEPLELALRSIVMMGAPVLESMLPDDPAIMDQALEAISRKLLEMRSDGAHRLELVYHLDGDPVLELPAGE